VAPELAFPKSDRLVSIGVTVGNFKSFVAQSEELVFFEDQTTVKIYTRTGDDGSTGVLGGGRLPKDDLRIEAYGTVDELNAALGVVLAQSREGAAAVILARVQEELFLVGAALADQSPRGRFRQAVGSGHVRALEDAIDELEEGLQPLAHFILPGGSPAAAQLHIARAVCRRAERRVVAFARAQPDAVPEVLVVYLNRLSDLLFVLARAANQAAGLPDIPWKGPVQ